MYLIDEHWNYNISQSATILRSIYHSYLIINDGKQVIRSYISNRKHSEDIRCVPFRCSMGSAYRWLGVRTSTIHHGMSLSDVWHRRTRGWINWKWCHDFRNKRCEPERTKDRAIYIVQYKVPFNCDYCHVVRRTFNMSYKLLKLYNKYNAVTFSLRGAIKIWLVISPMDRWFQDNVLSYLELFICQ